MSDHNVLNNNHVLDAEFGDAALAAVEEAISEANDAGVFCDACVKKIDAEHRPVDFCSACHSVLRLWVTSIIECVCAQMNAEQPGRFTIRTEVGKTLVRRNW